MAGLQGTCANVLASVLPTRLLEVVAEEAVVVAVIGVMAVLPPPFQFLLIESACRKFPSDFFVCFETVPFACVGCLHCVPYTNIYILSCAHVSVVSFIMCLSAVHSLPLSLSRALIHCERFVCVYACVGAWRRLHISGGGGGGET